MNALELLARARAGVRGRLSREFDEYIACLPISAPRPAGVDVLLQEDHVDADGYYAETLESAAGMTIYFRRPHRPPRWHGPDDVL